jgi:hypothetical protein
LTNKYLMGSTYAHRPWHRLANTLAG